MMELQLWATDFAFAVREDVALKSFKFHWFYMHTAALSFRTGVIVCALSLLFHSPTVCHLVRAAYRPFAMPGMEKAYLFTSSSSGFPTMCCEKNQ